MTLNKTARLLPALLLSVLGLIFTHPANAASACKGLSSSACSSNSSCGWVDGYKRKDGVKVKAHCRGKAKKSTAKKSSTKKKAADTKKKSTKKSTKKTDSKKTKKKESTKKPSSTN